MRLSSFAKVFWPFSFVTVLLFYIVRQKLLYSGNFISNCFNLGMPLWMNITLGITILVVFSVTVRKLAEVNWLTTFGYMLILAGSSFNLFEKFWTGCVIDYLNITGSTAFPVFNLPDVAISVGVLTLGLGICISKQ